MDLLHTYANWIRRSPDAAQRIEDVANILQAFAPSGYGEIAYSATNLLSLLHDAIIMSEQRPRESRQIEQARWFLSILSGIDVLVEAAAAKFTSTRTKHRVIVAVEAARAFAKLMVLLKTKERILISGGTVREPATEVEIPAITLADVDVASPTPPKEPAPRYWKGGLSGMVIPLPSDYKIAETASNTSPGEVVHLWKQLHAAIKIIVEHRDRPAEAVSKGVRDDGAGYPDVKVGVACEDESAPLFTLGEVNHILRPLVWAILRSVCQECSWIPGDCEALVPGYAIQAVSTSAYRLQALLRSFFSPATGEAIVANPKPAHPIPFGFNNPPGMGASGALEQALATKDLGVAALILRFGMWLLKPSVSVSASEAAELQRRRMLWALYLLRTPIFQAVTLPASDGAIAVTSWVPLLGTLLKYGRDMLVSLNTHHFYNSGST